MRPFTYERAATPAQAAAAAGGEGDGEIADFEQAHATPPR